MTSIYPKQGLVCGERATTVAYVGDAENGLRIALAHGGELALSAQTIRDVLASWRAWNPLLAPADGSEGEARPNRLETWRESVAPALIGRTLDPGEMRRMLGVFGGEGLIPVSFSEDGFVSCGLPELEARTALAACVGRRCLFREKGILILVRIDRLEGNDEYLELVLEAMPAPGFSAQAPEIFSVGARPKDIRLEPGLARASWIPWFLVTDPARIEHFIAFAAKQPGTRALIEEFGRSILCA